MLFTILLSLLAEVSVICATEASSEHENLAAQGLGGAFHTDAGRDLLHAQHIKLVTRQASPPITTDPDCTLYDGYFYTTARNYSWQLQCSNSYDGTIVAQTTDTTDLGSCIGECVSYNRAHTPGACMAVTFSGSYSGGDTVCIQYSSIDAVNLASEEGGVVNSALLILGPDGEIFATPSPEPTFSGAPTQPPDVDPVPSQTTTTAGSILTSAPLSTTQYSSVFTVYTASTKTTTLTSTIVYTSCLVDQTCQASTAPTALPSGPGTPGGIGSQITSTPLINISDGGSRPASSLATISGAGMGQESITSGGIIVDAQTTFTTIVPFTEYRVQIVELCAATPTPCSQTASTATDVMYKTEISCSPSACAGVIPTAAYLVDAILGATCVVAA